MSSEESDREASSDRGSASFPRFSPKGRRPALRMRIFPDSVLRRVCDPVDDFSSALDDLFVEMTFMMNAHEGIGLAAPQVGVEQRLFVAKISGAVISIANPVIRSHAGWDVLSEGCLSLPGQQFDIVRNTVIEVDGFDARGRRCTHKVEGFWARVMQHEIDHLNGVLICDVAENKGRP
ncbi:MAG: peptide deformylase [Vicinamibacteria bacterium]|nr:peptide deformylase [Vicinamibacteria bacterium]